MGDRQSSEAKARQPIADILIPYLAGLKKKRGDVGPDDAVFVGRTGNPIDAHNYFNRVLKPIGEELKMPWIGWHSFRRAHSTMADRLASAMSDRMAMMGHASAKMTLHYSDTDLKRRKGVVDQMAQEIFGKNSGSIQ